MTASDHASQRWTISEPFLPSLLRFGFYSAIIFGMIGLVPIILRYGGIGFFKENGPIEWVQFSLLAISTAVFLFAAKGNPGCRAFFLLLASTSAFAAIRELDSFLFAIAPLIGWRIAFVLPILMAVVYYRSRDILPRQIVMFFSTRAFSMLWAGFVIAVPVSQMLGHGPFLEQLIGEHYQRGYKRVIEESGEFVGYVVLFFGSLESMIQMKCVKAVPDGESRIETK